MDENALNRVCVITSVIHQTFPQVVVGAAIRMLATNGEINTLKGNIKLDEKHEIRSWRRARWRKWPKTSKPIVAAGSSRLFPRWDAVFEVLGGARVDSAPIGEKTMLVPEAGQKSSAVELCLRRGGARHMYSYCNSVDGALDGPRQRWQ